MFSGPGSRGLDQTDAWHQGPLERAAQLRGAGRHQGQAGAAAHICAAGKLRSESFLNATKIDYYCQYLSSKWLVKRLFPVERSI